MINKYDTKTMIKLKINQVSGSIRVFYKDHWWQRWREYDYSNSNIKVTKEWVLNRISCILSYATEFRMTAM